MFIGINQGVETRRIAQAFLDQKGLQRLHTQGDIRRNCLVVATLLLVVDGSEIVRSRRAPQPSPQLSGNRVGSCSAEPPFPSENLVGVGPYETSGSCTEHAC
jgi:hypothetical protein